MTEALLNLITLGLFLLCLILLVLTSFIVFLIVQRRFIRAAELSAGEHHRPHGYWRFMLKGLWANRFLRTTSHMTTHR
jgi:hypothetical protein